MMMIKQEEPKAMQQDTISSSKMQQRALNVFSYRVHNLSAWIEEIANIDDDTKDAAVIALAQIHGAYGMMIDILDALEDDTCE